MIGDARGSARSLSNVSDVTGGDERIFVYTALLSDGTLFYLLGVAPRAEFERLRYGVSQHRGVDPVRAVGYSGSGSSSSQSGG